MINLGGDAETLEVDGGEHVRIYQAMLERGSRRVKSRHQRKFCGQCGSHLWAWNERWPELVHPVASAIDTPLPDPPEYVHLMVGSKANWVHVEGKPGDASFEEYPKESLADWHRNRGLSD
jgi:hypothetical protein